VICGSRTGLRKVMERDRSYQTVLGRKVGNPLRKIDEVAYKQIFKQKVCSYSSRWLISAR
jgi:hypothetical protein